ncbi:MAG: FAD-dependent oxidoreductase [Saprospiraceae bacterium]|nr:FAD-dependent oxidoreductase [Saprospiraceae bacterium]
MGCEKSSPHPDICILSSSEAAFTAAIQAARMGKKVVLIEPTGHRSGMMVEGIVKGYQVW